ncbi:C2H2 zinc finger protein [Pyrenophora tritici-repentis]|nr:C2H2 zinc finger protein [Pyrenophora tritici-repentis]KAF7566535.1 hypothetical protein PtrM4_148550 [Pyrenophora tritici-repentis]KAI1542772.1 C2H2 zinc finger protein [Pyrenophora tritici-repentis]KAI1574064.1 C2H2 zinc finger protein [Pyrenophora tritici-repentis]KAI1583252.1 C2H2 zinc finger protein [Pyrenophora tritici-repentis]
MSEPTSTINSSTSKDDSQKHLEVSRAQIQRETSDPGDTSPFDPFNEQSQHRSVLRNLSNASSSESSFADSCQNSSRQEGQNSLAPGSSYAPSPNASGVNLSQGETPPQDTTGTESMFNFQSLTKALNPEGEHKNENKPQYIEDVGEAATESKTSYVNGKAPEAPADVETKPSETLADSTMTLKPSEDAPKESDAYQADDISPAPPVQYVSDGHSHLDQKHVGEVSMVHGLNHEATQ